jgi:DNA-binding NarL/FixJ family response regulator
MQATIESAEDSTDEISSPAPIRTYVLQGQLLVAKALHLALDQEPDIQVVGSQITTLLAIERILHAEADVVLLDASLDAVELAARLQRSPDPPRIIVTSADDATELLLPCVEAGVVGFLPNSSTVTELASAVRRAHAGWSVFTIEQVATLVESRVRRPSHAFAVEACKKLSAREREVLQVLATGASIGETAAELCMSSHTAQTHLKNAMRKLNATSKLAAVMIALRGGIVQE